MADHDLFEATAALDALGGVSVIDPRMRLAKSRGDGARVQRTLALTEVDPVEPHALSDIAIGDSAWVHVIVELFTKVGWRIRALRPFPTTRFIGNSDDYR